jgi:hypothetical protein
VPSLAGAITAGSLSVDARAVPLADVERVWPDDAGAERVVLVP